MGGEVQPEGFPVLRMLIGARWAHTPSDNPDPFRVNWYPVTGTLSMPTCYAWIFCMSYSFSVCTSDGVYFCLRMQFCQCDWAQLLQKYKGYRCEMSGNLLSAFVWLRNALEKGTLRYWLGQPFGRNVLSSSTFIQKLNSYTSSWRVRVN